MPSNRPPRLELVKSEVSQDEPPAFLTQAPLGISLESDHERSILYSETAVIKKRRPAKKAKVIAWLLEELSFTMNKMSLAGLVFGLMVLGTLFFVIGFLVAVTTLNTPSYTTSYPQQASWPSATTASTQQQAPQRPGLFGRIASKLIRDEAVKVESKMGGGALGGVITQHVPAPLQPFAQQAQNKVTMKMQQNVNRLATAITPGNRPQPPYHPHQQQAPQGHPSVQQPAPQNSQNQALPPTHVAPPQQPQAYWGAPQPAPYRHPLTSPPPAATRQPYPVH